MKRLHVTAHGQLVAVLGSLLFLNSAVGFALPGGPPPLDPAARAGLLRASAGGALLPWQRQTMRSLADRGTSPSRATGTDGSWTELPPPPLQEVPAVYDPVRQSMLLFGGMNGNGGLTNDVWEFTLSGTPTWTRLQTAGSPPSPRSSHVLLFDSRRERLLVFGGADSITHNDCWTLDLTAVPPAWAQGSPTGTPPSRRAYAQAVYDSLNDRAILFGGADSVVQYGPPIDMRADVWAIGFTGPSAWTELTPSGTPPSPRAAGAVIYDRARQRMVLFGGYDGTPLGDGFTLSLGGSPAWAPLGASGGPPAARAIPGVVYDAPDDQMVIFGGYDGASRNDVWALDLAASAWTELTPTGGPPSPRQSPAAVYDPPRDRMLIFGGSTETGTVPDPLWSLSLGTSVAWTDLGGQRAPGRWDAAAAYDPTRSVMWIHGGQGWDMNQLTRSDLWSLPLSPATGWTQPATTGTPLGKRYGHSAIYDPVRDRLLFFGGSDSVSYLNDVWALSLSGTPAWSQLSPTGTPPDPRAYQSAVYDAPNDRLVIFGGFTGSTSLSDVWALSLAGTPAWSQLLPSGTAPPFLIMQCAAMDRSGNRMIVFGGWGPGGLQNKVYALSLTGSPAWAELSPSGTPPAPREGGSMVSLGSRMLVFGGYTGDPVYGTDDTWLLTLYPTPSWRQLDVGPLLPPARLDPAGVFDQATFRFVLFGGTGLNTSGDDTWILQIDQAVPALASLVSANAGPDRVELTWEVPSSGAPATVYRSSGDGQWAAIGRLIADGTGRATFVDRDVNAGSRYGYRLGLADGSREVFAGEIWVNVPASARLALHGMTPNPAPAGAAVIGFSLPDARPARLEVVDVAGRRVFAQEVGSLGGGEHAVRVNGAAPLPPGLYLIRLTQGIRTLTAKAVTVH
jgi:hypothetical protein